MRRRSTPLLLLQVAGILVLFYSRLILTAQAAHVSEDQLIKVLSSSTASLREKDAACAELKFIGTSRSVPALSALLLNEDLSQTARYVLEVMQAPEAGDALLKALPMAQGATRLGIIQSLGARKQSTAVTQLAELLKNDDPPVVAASALSLAQIGGPQALNTLENALKQPRSATQPLVTDAALMLAEATRVAGDCTAASRLLQTIVETTQLTRFQVAAYRGLILCSGSDAITSITAAFSSAPGPKQTAALAAARELPGPEMTKALVKSLPRANPLLQVALVEALAQRGDRSALPAINQLAASGSGELRVSALDALGKLGDGSSVSILAQAAANGSREEKVSARSALINLQALDISSALLRELADGKPAVQAEIARALGERGQNDAMPQVLALSRTVPEAARGAVFEAAAALAQESDLPALVQLVTSATDEPSRTQAAEALNSAYQRLLLANSKVDAGPLASASVSGSSAVRVALFPVCAGVVDVRTKEALLKGASDPEASVREAAIRAMTATQDATLLPDLARLGCSLPEQNLRSLAISGAVRMAASEDPRAADLETRLTALKSLLNCRPNPDQTKMILSGLGRIADTRSLELVEGMLGNSAVAVEAGRAILQIAPGLGDTDRAMAALQKAVSTVQDPDTRSALQDKLNVLQAKADYLRAWQVAGPYKQEGKNYAALFDAAFAPEQQNTNVAWRAPATTQDTQKPEVIDLLKQFGGEQCVAYARTWVYSPNSQPAILELGSDDGIKVWLNGRVVHANNAARPLQPGSDKVAVNLQAGWNALLLKVTQNNLGWEFCARFVKPDGSRLTGLKTTAQPPES